MYVHSIYIYICNIYLWGLVYPMDRFAVEAAVASFSDVLALKTIPWILNTRPWNAFGRCLDPVARCSAGSGQYFRFRVLGLFWGCSFFLGFRVLRFKVWGFRVLGCAVYGFLKRTPSSQIETSTLCAGYWGTALQTPMVQSCDSCWLAAKPTKPHDRNDKVS